MLISMLYIVILISMLLANVFGVLFHYTHNKYTRSLMLHIFSATNESTWEHLKLAFAPMFFLSFIHHFLLKSQYNNTLESNLLGILLTLLLIPTLYYPIRYILKKEVVLVSILIFVLSVILGYLLVYFLLNRGISFLGEGVSLGILIGLFILFGIFTFYTPKNFLFKDPVTGQYGHR